VPSTSAIRSIIARKGVPTTRPGRRTVWHSAAARAPEKPSKTQRSRARSGQLQCRVGRLLGSHTAFQSAKRTALWHGTAFGFGRATRRAHSRRHPTGKRCVRPLRCACGMQTASVAGMEGAFRVGALPLTFGYGRTVCAPRGTRPPYAWRLGLPLLLERHRPPKIGRSVASGQVPQPLRHALCD